MHPAINALDPPLHEIFRALKFDKTRYNPSWLDKSIGRAAL